MRAVVRRAVDFAIENSVLMVTGAVAALAWANVDPAGYSRAVHPLHFAVNDVGMVFFFGLAVKEIIEATAPGGALHSMRRASLPVVAAVGGMLGPALLYVAFALWADRQDLLRGWAVPCATDIAFSYLIARFVFGARHPAVPFLLLLAIADDALGLIVLAVAYPSGVLRPGWLAVLLAASCALAWWLRRRQRPTFWAYLAGPGVLAWAGLYVGGLHPALALVPVLPFFPHAHRDPGVLVDPARPLHDPLNEFERWWRTPVEVILFLFALTNAGVPVTVAGTGTWIVLGAILLGKPIGITISTIAAAAAGLQTPVGLRVRDVVVVGMVAAIGFTVALFFATAAFPEDPALGEAKLGALLSLSAALFAPLSAVLLGVGRWARPR